MQQRFSWHLEEGSVERSGGCTDAAMRMSNLLKVTAAILSLRSSYCGCCLALESSTLSAVQVPCILLPESSPDLPDFFTNAAPSVLPQDCSVITRYIVANGM